MTNKKENILIILALLVLALFISIPGCDDDKKTSSKPRILVSTDLGGADPDDVQSAIHLLLYADVIDLEGFVASTPKGKKQSILDLINVYELDYPTLKKSGDYPTAQHLRTITKQGNRTANVGAQNEGTQLIIERARAKDNRKLNIIVWGSLTDVATALQVAPDIADKINVISLGAWNTRQDRKAHSVLWNMRSQLVWTDINTTFRAMYKGWPLADNKNWVEKYIKPAGNLGAYFHSQSRHIDTGSYSIKMGDTPTFFIALKCNPLAPVDSTCWGGQYRVKYPEFPTYFTDLQGQEIEGYAGGQTINKWRPHFLADFAMRLRRLR